MTGWAGARRGGTIAAIVLVFSGCGLQGDTGTPTASPSPTELVDASSMVTGPVTFEDDDGLYTIELPAGWNFEKEHASGSGVYRPTSDYWTTGPEARLPLTASAEVIAQPTRPFVPLSDGVDQDIWFWGTTLRDPVESELHDFLTDAGGRGVWQTVTGKDDGAEKTVYVIHVTDGPMDLEVIIQTYGGEVDAADTLVAAMRTVQFSGAPFPGIEQVRTAAPADEAGRWFSYCRAISMAAQDGWVYTPSDGVDGLTWQCPDANGDYLGAWTVPNPDGEALVVVTYEVLFYESATDGPRAVGDVAVGPEFTSELVGLGTLALPSGGDADWEALKVTTADGSATYFQTYTITYASGGRVQFAVRLIPNGPDGDYDWIIPALDSITKTN